MKKIDITAIPKYGRLTILKDNKEKILLSKNKQRYVDVLCDCGNKKVIRLNHITTGKTTSCGCYRNEKIKEASSSHQQSKTNLYKRWCKIKERCFNKKSNQYIRYGRRGITMCNEWKNDYTKFRDWALANGYKKELQIDRINNDGNYEPNNCRWTTSKINSNNKSNTLFITYRNKRLPLKDWCEQLNLNYKMVWERIKYGKWDINRAFTPRIAQEDIEKQTIDSSKKI